MNNIETLARIRAAENARHIAEAERLRGARLVARPGEARLRGTPSLAARAWAALTRRTAKA